MSDENIQQMLVRYLRNAHAMEQNVLHMLTTMVLTTPDEEFKGHLEHHKDETRRHMQLLEERLTAHDSSPSTMKEVGAVLGALVKGTGDAIRHDRPGQNARDGFVTENLEIATYEFLGRLARRAGDEETGTVADKILAEEVAMRDRFAERWDLFVDLTLDQEGITVS